MNTEKTESHEWVSIPLPAMFTMREIKRIEEEILAQIEQNHVHLVMDAAGSALIDSTSITLLLKYHKILQERGGDLRIKGLRGEPLVLFQITGLDRLLAIEDVPAGTAESSKVSADDAQYELMLHVDFEPQVDVAVFHFSGVLCFPDGPKRIRDKLHRNGRDRKKILLDMKNLKYLDSLSLGQLLNLCRKLQDTGGELRYANANELTKDIFRRTGFDRIIRGYETLEQAIADWKGKDTV